MSLANQKGGVGKTTSAVNIATGIAAIGKKVLIIDLDPQGNASTGMGILQNQRKFNSYNLVMSNENPRNLIQNTMIPNIDVIPATIDLAGAEVELFELQNKELHLKSRLNELRNLYEFIVIDCPPSLGLLTINALCATDYLIIPLQCEFFALEGLAHLTRTVGLIKKSLNKTLTVLGIALTMIDKRNKLSTQVEEDVRENFGDLVFATSIPRNIKLSEAPSHGKPALIYDSKCIGSLAYMLLTKEIINRLKLLNDNEEYHETREKSVG
ncbi:MAG: ParA family protein [Rickettsiales bacterium]